MIVSIFISTLVMTAIVMSFQNFVAFQNWVVQFSFLQKHSFQELQIMKSFLEPSSISVKESEISARKYSHAFVQPTEQQFVFNSLVQDSGGTQINLLNTEGQLALHRHTVFGGMAQVANNLYFSDTGKHVIRKINLSDNSMTVYAGQEGSLGATNGAVGSANFSHPTGLVHDANNNILYVADTGNHIIRSINLATNQVTTFAGSIGAPGDSGGGTEFAHFSSPTGLAYDENNNVLYISDTGNQIIKRISSGVVTTVLGTSGITGNTGKYESFANFSAFSLSQPLQMVFDNTLNTLYLNDFSNKRVLAVREGIDVKVVREGMYFGDVRMYTDAVSQNFLLLQEQSSGKVLSLNTVDLALQELFDPNSLSSHDSSKFVYHSFVKNNDEYYVWGVDNVTGKWTMFKMNSALNSLLIWYGESSVYGDLWYWDTENYVFDKLIDVLGSSDINYLEWRKNPSGVLVGSYEVLLKYVKVGESGEGDTEISYSLVLGH
jgi:hypothetical protein